MFMRAIFWRYCLLSYCCLLPAALFAQEFPRGWVFPLEVGQGAATAFRNTPDAYLGTLAFSPQFTVIKGRLRAGVTAGGAYTQKRLYGTGGARLSLLLTSNPRVLYSTVLNLQLVAEHLWGTGEQRLAGGGITAELGQLATISVKAHRDYHLSEWWLQAGLGINLFRKKTPDNPFDSIR